MLLLHLLRKSINKIWISNYPDSNGLKVGIFNYDKDEEKEFLAMWDLTKPTLEEQTEETQRAINKLLT